jgi:hypothetical protein
LSFGGTSRYAWRELTLDASLVRRSRTAALRPLLAVGREF